MVLDVCLGLGDGRENFVVILNAIGYEDVDGVCFYERIHTEEVCADFGDAVEAFFGDFGNEVADLGVLCDEPFHGFACFFMWPLRAICDLNVSLQWGCGHL